MSYFQDSQRIREEIESQPGLLERVKQAYRGELQKFASGSSVDLFRIGRLQSGVHIALRKWNPDLYHNAHMGLHKQIEWMETYCQNAEELAAQGTEVPAFTVGVIRNNIAGILTEDLSAGELYEVVQARYPDPTARVVDNGSSRTVYVDIDPEFRAKEPIKRRYFAEGKHILT